MKNEAAAREALRLSYPDLKLRPINQATQESRVKAKKCTERLPYKPRPQTSVGAAQRLVGRHLGINIRVSKEEREKERQALKEARDQRLTRKQQTNDVWEGNVD